MYLYIYVCTYIPTYFFCLYSSAITELKKDAQNEMLAGIDMYKNRWMDGPTLPPPLPVQFGPG